MSRFESVLHRGSVQCTIKNHMCFMLVAAGAVYHGENFRIQARSEGSAVSPWQKNNLGRGNGRDSTLEEINIEE